MNLETVNELIASLESAGELSIKETKVMALAKAYHQLAADRDAVVAENVALKSAVDHTIEWIESTNGDPCDVVILKGIRTPATDRIVAGIKADGVEMVLDLIGHTKGMLYADSVKEMLSDVSSKLREGADK